MPHDTEERVWVLRDPAGKMVECTMTVGATLSPTVVMLTNARFGLFDLVYRDSLKPAPARASSYEFEGWTLALEPHENPRARVANTPAVSPHATSGTSATRADDGDRSGVGDAAGQPFTETSAP